MQTTLTPKIRYEIRELIDERIREKHVTREDFTELKEIVKELAKIGERTDLRIENIAKTQERTDLRIEKLAKAQERTDLRVERLAKAQERTELRVEELARAQERTELRVEELAKAQKETQEEIKILALTLKETKVELKEEIKNTKVELKEEIKDTNLTLKDTKTELKEEIKNTKVELKEEIKDTNLTLKDTKTELKSELKNTRQDLGGVTSTLGFMLENEAYRELPKLLKDKYGIEIKERFLRRSIKSFGINQEGEINIFSRGIHKNKEIVIVGESRSHLGKNDIDDLLDIAEKLKGIDEGERFLLAITHYARETVVEYAKEKGVEVIQSFEW